MAGPDSSPEFIARTAELTALADALDRAIAGRPSVFVIGGEAGIGKTRLLDEFARRCGETALVLVGRCFPSSRRAVPYAPFGDLLRDVLRKVPAHGLPAIVGPAAGELDLILPAFGQGASSAPRHAREATGENALVGRLRFFEVLLGIAERLQAARPTVIAIDDLQWADAATLDLLQFLARSIRDGRLLLVLTLRTDDLALGDPVMAALGQIERAATVRRIELAGFSRAELAAQLSAILGTRAGDDLVQRVLARSDGNPFFAEELLASIRRGEDADTPRVLDDLLRARLAALSDSARRVVRVAALVGMAVDDDFIAAVSGLQPEEVSKGLHEAADRGLIVRTEHGRRGFAFRHRLLQEAAAADLLPGERRRLHAACAQALEGVGPPSLVAGEIARHWILAERPDRALPAMVAAGLEAERRFAFADARHYLDEALSLTEVVPLPESVELDYVGILQHVADDAALEGDARGAVGFARRALETLEKLDEAGDARHAGDVGEAYAAGDADDVADGRRRAASIHDRLRWYLWQAGDLQGAERATDRALRLVPSDPPTGALARALAHSGWLRFRSGRLGEALALADRAVDASRACGAMADLAFGLGLRGWVRAAAGRVDDGLTDLREALAMAEFIGSAEGQGLGLAYLAKVQLYAGRVEEAADTVLRGVETMRRIGLERTYGASLMATASAAAYRAGRWNEAVSLVSKTLATAIAGPEAGWPGAVAVRIGAGRGDDALLRAGRDAAEPFLATADRIYTEWYRLAFVEADLWAGRAERAADAAAAAVQRLPADVLDEPAASAFTMAARALADRADSARLIHASAQVAAIEAEANDLALEWRRRREAVGSAVPDPSFLDATEPLLAAEVRRACGAGDGAGWESAAEAFAAVGVPANTGYARFREAEALLLAAADPSLGSVTARRAAAARPLASATEIAGRLGAAPLAAACAKLAGRARLDLSVAVPPERYGSQTVALPQTNQAAAFIGERHLTPREIEVLSLMASGWSNGEIATTLFISRKTASVHVSNVLGKLGVADRIEAAALAQRAGIEGPPPPGSVLANLEPNAG